LAKRKNRIGRIGEADVGAKKASVCGRVGKSKVGKKNGEDVGRFKERRGGKTWANGDNNGGGKNDKP